MSANGIDLEEIDITNSTILIVDDNPTNLAVAVEYLETSGFTVLVAQDGESGIMRAQFARPQIILLDILMPGSDGFEICRRLKDNEETKQIPIIFLTALSNLEDKIQGFKYGAVDYITKPIQREELLVRITTHLRIQALTQQLISRNQQLQEQALELKVAKELAEEANQQLERLAHLDGLTQIANRRRFDEYYNLEWRRSVREQTSLSLLLCDIDFFKKYNDYYGHQAGDECLRRVARAIARITERPGDLVARYGGEEIAIILPRTNAQGAVQIAEMIHLAIKQLQIPHLRSKVSPYLTISIGISSLIASQDVRLESLFAAADRALYIAKERGRNMYYLHIV
jgi:diguanylate cyclase (GGDEF)-like protein